MKPYEDDIFDRTEWDEFNEDEMSDDIWEEDELSEISVADQAEPEEINEDMIQVGSNVLHRCFGLGKIIEIDNTRRLIKVEFNNVEKLFSFPDAFKKGYLRVPKMS